MELVSIVSWLSVAAVSIITKDIYPIVLMIILNAFNLKELISVKIDKNTEEEGM